jgi:methyltransferase (TIGR00027 family)
LKEFPFYGIVPESAGSIDAVLTSSLTALTAAAARAAHLIVDDEPRIFNDPLAATLLGDRADELINYHRANGTHTVLIGARTQVTVRSRYTEERVAQAVERGVDQYVILGAGLDSFAYRSPLAARMRVFEVDHPATQQWKRERLSTADTVSYVPVDFEHDSLADRLARGGFDPTRPAVVSWLGVTVYLSQLAIGQALDVLGGFAPGTELVVEYLVPDQLRDEHGRTFAELVMPFAAEQGEPWLTLLTPDEMSALLADHGFGSVEHVRQRDAVDAALWDRTDSLRPSDLAFIARASVNPRPGRLRRGA